MVDMDQQIHQREIYVDEMLMVDIDQQIQQMEFYVDEMLMVDIDQQIHQMEMDVFVHEMEKNIHQNHPDVILM
jgi:hypothetical protein